MLFTRLLQAAERAAFLPSLCAVCHDWGRSRVCELCLDRYAPEVPRCRQCALQIPAGTSTCGACLTDPPPFARTIAAVDYGHPWDALITRFKFHEALDLAAVLAGQMLAARRIADAPLPALLLPIPLSDTRLQQRGYNQAWTLARRLGTALRCPAEPTLLLRVRDTPHQLALPPDARAGNMRGAFAVEPRRRAELQGRSVTLVDDVMTTGATVAEAARAVLQAGASDVGVWIVARTPRHETA